MYTVLFDTNIVSYWHGGLPEWRIPLQSLIAEIEKEHSYVLAISSITYQELGVWAKNPQRAQGTWDVVKDFLSKTFKSLSFDRSCAEFAAEFESTHGRPGRTKPKSANADMIDGWNHDCAIIGTAIHHKVDLLVTGEGQQWNKYKRLFESYNSGRIRSLSPVPVEGTAQTAAGAPVGGETLPTRFSQLDLDDDAIPPALDEETKPTEKK